MPPTTTRSDGIELALDPAALGDVARERRGSHDPPDLVPDRRHRDRHIDPAAIPGIRWMSSWRTASPARALASRLPDRPRRSGGTSMVIDAPRCFLLE
jgi:hypothetical protein